MQVKVKSQNNTDISYDAGAWGKLGDKWQKSALNKLKIFIDNKSLVPFHMGNAIKFIT